MLVASGLLTVGTAGTTISDVQAQMYDNQYGYDNNYNNYYQEPKSSHTDIQRTFMTLLK
jgi:hypothetical protein